MQDDFAVLSDVETLEYRLSQEGETNAPSKGLSSIERMLERKLKTISIKELARQTGVDRNAIRRVLRGERVHAETRRRLLKDISG
jgi:helix-turn-helix protein